MSFHRHLVVLHGEDGLRVLLQLHRLLLPFAFPFLAFKLQLLLLLFQPAPPEHI